MPRPSRAVIRNGAAARSDAARPPVLGCRQARAMVIYEQTCGVGAWRGLTHDDGLQEPRQAPDFADRWTVWSSVPPDSGDDPDRSVGGQPRVRHRDESE